MDINKSWERALLTSDVTLQEAINNLNETGLQIILIISKHGKFEGTITDGDIRRGLLRGLKLTSPIINLVNQNAFIVPPEMNKEGVLHLMRANRLHQIPIVNKEQQVVGLHLLEEFSEPERIPHKIVIMAGGLGIRLRPQTETCPKPLLPVGGKPILEHIIERASLQGFTDFTFSVYYLAHMIVQHFEKGQRWNVSIDYVHETSPMGTAGALSLLNPKPDRSFVVLNGDILSTVRYGELLDFHRRYNAVATMVVRKYEWQHPFGVVQTEGVDIIGFQEKPMISSYVNAGIYILEPQALDLIEKDTFCDMPMLFDRLRQRGLRTVVYPIHEDWLDIGFPESLEMANKNMVEKYDEKRYEEII